MKYWIILGFTGYVFGMLSPYLFAQTAIELSICAQNCSAPQDAHPKCESEVSGCSVTLQTTNITYTQPPTPILTQNNTGNNCNNALNNITIQAGTGWTKTNTIAYTFGASAAATIKVIFELQVQASVGFTFGQAHTLGASCSMNVFPCHEAQIEQTLLQSNATATVHYQLYHSGSWQTKATLLGGSCPIDGNIWGPSTCGLTKTISANLTMFAAGQCTAVFHQPCASSTNPACSAINPNVIIVPPPSCP